MSCIKIALLASVALLGAALPAPVDAQGADRYWEIYRSDKANWNRICADPDNWRRFGVCQWLKPETMAERVARNRATTERLMKDMYDRVKGLEAEGIYTEVPVELEAELVLSELNDEKVLKDEAARLRALRADLDRREAALAAAQAARAAQKPAKAK